MPSQFFGGAFVLLIAAQTLAEDSARGAPHVAASIQAGAVLLDPAKILGPDSCSQCHGSELQVLRSTPHFRTFDELHRKPEAKEIAKKMGIRSIKRGDLCIRCHYTPQIQDAQLRPIAGVSCETCHGPARDWIAIHSDYGGATASKGTETPEHCQHRLRASIEAGMRNPVNPYLVARSCLNCHTIPEEKLVNLGGHPATRPEFEFVAWAEGSLRHNFLRAKNTGNPVSSPERLRVMYVAGLMADLEYSLRATGKATEVKEYGIALAKRAYTVRRRLADVQEKLHQPQLAEALEIAYAVKLKSSNQAQLEEAADRIGMIAYEFADTVDGSTLAAIDVMLPSPATYK